MDVGDVRRFLGMVNQLCKSSPLLAKNTRPLRERLRKDRTWLWSNSQQRAFKEVKTSLTTAPLFSLFDPTRETVVSADASSYALSAVLLQRQSDGGMRPILYNIIIRPQCSFTSGTARWRNEPHLVQLKVNVIHRTTICPNRKRSVGTDMSLGKSIRLPHRTNIYDWNRP